MNGSSGTIEISIYLRGANLDPALVSSVLGIMPSKSQASGEKKRTSSGKDFVTRIGLWTLAVEANSGSLSDMVRDLVARVKDRSVHLAQITGVDDAYLDIFLAVDADVDGGGTCAFELSDECVASLNGLGLPVRFTIAVVRP